MKDTNRIEYFDVAKGIAILAVILGHCQGLTAKQINFIFSFHMPIFFFCTGYFLKQRSFIENLVIKGKQLLIPYVITGAVVLITSTSWLVFRGNHVDVIYSNIIISIWALFYGSGTEYQTPTYVPNAQALWFFCALFFACIIVNECIKQKYTFIWIGCTVLLGYFTSKLLWLPLSIQAGMVSTIYVYFGYQVKQYNILKLLDKRLFSLEIFIIYFLYYIWGGGRLYLVRNWIEQGIWEIIGSFFAILCVLKISYFITKKTKVCKNILAFLGKNTLLILCLHIIDLSVFNWGIIYERFSNFDIQVLVWLVFVLRSIWAIGGMIIIKYIVRKRKSTRLLNPSKDEKIYDKSKERNLCIDISRGLAILLMVYAHYPINQMISIIIFSFHMPIFILISGYFYNKNEPLKISMIKILKSLIIPYLGVAVGYAFIFTWKYILYTDISIVSGRQAAEYFIEKLIMIPWGISYTSTKFQNIESVGPIWFIICLALIRVLYGVVSKVLINEKILTVGILSISVSGYLIGKYFAFLPWSADVAMVCLAFFHIGQLLKNTHFLEKKLDISLYLFLFIIWILDIHYAGLDLASRRFEIFPLSIAGGVAGSILVIDFSRFLMRFESVKQFLSFCGKYSMLILCIHCLEQRNCAWGLLLPEISENIVFIIRIISILTFVIVTITIKEGRKYYFSKK